MYRPPIHCFFCGGWFALKGVTFGLTWPTGLSAGVGKWAEFFTHITSLWTPPPPVIWLHWVTQTFDNTMFAPLAKCQLLINNNLTMPGLRYVKITKFPTWYSVRLSSFELAYWCCRSNLVYPNRLTYLQFHHKFTSTINLDILSKFTVCVDNMFTKCMPIFTKTSWYMVLNFCSVYHAFRNNWSVCLYIAITNHHHHKFRAVMKLMPR